MKKQREIGQALQQLGLQKQSFTALVKSVDGYTCTVEDDGYTIYNVRLRSSIDSSRNAVILVPKVNSYVMVNRIMGQDQYYVSMVSEVDTVKMNIDNKYIFKNLSTSLKSILNGFVTEIKMAIIDTPAGTGSINAATKAKLELLDQKINQLFDE